VGDLSLACLSNPSPTIPLSLQVLPIKIKAPSFNAKDGAVAIEEMQIAYKSFTVTPA